MFTGLGPSVGIDELDLVRFSVDCVDLYCTVLMYVGVAIELLGLETDLSMTSKELSSKSRSV